MFTIPERKSNFFSTAKLEGKHTIRIVSEHISGYKCYVIETDPDGFPIPDANGETKQKAMFFKDISEVPKNLPPNRWGDQRPQFFVGFVILHEGEIKIAIFSQSSIYSTIHDFCKTNGLEPTDFDFVLEKKTDGGKVNYVVSPKIPTPLSLTEAQKEAVNRIKLDNLFLGVSPFLES